MLPISSFFLLWNIQKKCLSMDYFSFSILLKFHWITALMEKNVKSDWVEGNFLLDYIYARDGILKHKFDINSFNNFKSSAVVKNH